MWSVQSIWLMLFNKIIKLDVISLWKRESSGSGLQFTIWRQLLPFLFPRALPFCDILQHSITCTFILSHCSTSVPHPSHDSLLVKLSTLVQGHSTCHLTKWLVNCHPFTSISYTLTKYSIQLAELRISGHLVWRLAMAFSKIFHFPMITFKYSLKSLIMHHGLSSCAYCLIDLSLLHCCSTPCTFLLTRPVKTMYFP